LVFFWVLSFPRVFLFRDPLIPIRYASDTLFRKRGISSFISGIIRLDRYG
jgi:hypothetical protein